MGRDNLLLPGADGPQQSSILDDPRQRRILAVLQARSEPIDIEELAAEISATETGDERERIRVDLYHRCLPKLESVGWIERDQQRITAAEPLPFGTGSPLPALEDLDDQFWDAVDALLGSPRRQHLVSVVGEHQHPRSLDELVRELTGETAYEEYDDEATVRTLLHHVDLPKLDDVGLVEYDPETNQATRTAVLMLLGNQIGAGSSTTDTRARCGDDRS